MVDLAGVFLCRAYVARILNGRSASEGGPAGVNEADNKITKGGRNVTLRRWKSETCVDSRLVRDSEAG